MSTVKEFWSQLNRNTEYSMGINCTITPFEILFGMDIKIATHILSMFNSFNSIQFRLL